MNKRDWILSIVLGVVVGLGLSIVEIFFLAYKAVFQSIVLLLLGFGSISMGIYHVRTTKVQGKRIRWWRHFLVVSGLFWVCMGIVVLIHALFPVLILSLLIVGFFIYSLILLFKDLSKMVKDE
jgi:hypothetical protein